MPTNSERALAPPAALAEDSLRYWLALLQYEEALAARPKARRGVADVTSAINLREPVPGQDYAKLAYDGAERFLTDRHGAVVVELSREWCIFFEDWLAARYRRGEDDSQSLEHWALFPTLHLPRDELAGLLRFPVEIQWRTQQGDFSVPTAQQLRSSPRPDTPLRARLTQPSKEPEHALPFFVDAHTLRDVLRLGPEDLDALFGRLRDKRDLQPREMVWALCTLIEQRVELDRADVHSPDAVALPAFPKQQPDPSALLDRLSGATGARLEQVGSRARVYPVALVLNGSGARTTWHLQRDIEVALALVEQGGIESRSPLLEYLSGQATPARESLCWGRWSEVGLTNSQREACEIALGSVLSAVQGPPGTGKTTLILNILAHTLVRKVRALAKEGRMGAAITVAASTNNRAVDNVVDPLGREMSPERLPLSLRVGSRRIADHVTQPALARVQRWLESPPFEPELADEHLKRELSRFSALYDDVAGRVQPLQSYQRSLERRQAIEADLGKLPPPERGPDELRRALLSWAAAAVQSGPEAEREALVDRFLDDASNHAVAAMQLSSLVRRLRALSRATEGPETRATLAKVRRHFKRTRQRQLKQVMARFGLGLEGFLPPSVEIDHPGRALEAWEEGAEAAIAVLAEVEQFLSRSKTDQRSRRKRAALEVELDELKRSLPLEPPELSADARVELDALHRELFVCATRVREAWAVCHRGALIEAVEWAQHSLRATGALRSLMGRRGPQVTWLRQLFPAWGCTLLSLGNTFWPRPDCIDHVVIDEAGQCHPAYAVAALLRARSALVIGDTHQLEPVVGLTADDERRIFHGQAFRVAREVLAPFRVHEDSATSAQTLADRAVRVRPTLVDHFRCQPAIAAISEALCNYGLRAHTVPRSQVARVPELAAPVLHVPVAGTQERFAGSWHNEEELSITVDLTRRLLDAGMAAHELGVITPYRGQLERLWRAFRKAGVPLARLAAETDETQLFEVARDRGLALGTVHRFQGGERTIILLTTAVTRRASLGFLNGRVNLVNVAASRAREHLITIGHTETLLAGAYTKHLVERATLLEPAMGRL